MQRMERMLSGCAGNRLIFYDDGSDCAERSERKCTASPGTE